MKLSYLDLMTTDPSYNLAMEQYVFDCLPRDRMYFMLWQNDNAIIVGKYQNTISEINEEAVRERGIRVVRRLSGGGAVYHDMGNLNFTFITDAGGSSTLDMKLFCEPVVRTLAALGVRAEVNGRNDITIDGKKFSGNSQYLRQGRVMHHGTIMFDSDLSVVGEALRVDPTKIQTKGIRSVRSRVTNVAEHLPEKVTLPEFRRILLENILKENPGEAYPLTQDDLAAVEKLRAERYATWDWNYGFSPACTMLRRRRVDGCGLIEAYITVEHGLISVVAFKGDFFSAEEPEDLAARFVGHTPDRAGYTAALDGVEERAEEGLRALGFRLNFHADTRIPAAKLPLALNQHLPPDIRVLDAQPVPEDFHARYAAHTKTYLYRIHNHPIDSPFDAAYYTRVPRHLDEARMQAAAQQFVGRHDFLALCAAGSSAAAHGDTVRTITDCHVTRKGDEIDIEVTADGYLYNMVRILAGTLCEAGVGRLDPAEIPAILESRDRSRAGPTLPAKGLFLKCVEYDL